MQKIYIFGRLYIFFDKMFIQIETRICSNKVMFRFFAHRKSVRFNNFIHICNCMAIQLKVAQLTLVLSIENYTVFTEMISDLKWLNKDANLNPLKNFLFCELCFTIRTITISDLISKKLIKIICGKDNLVYFLIKNVPNCF